MPCPNTTNASTRGRGVPLRSFVHNRECMAVRIMEKRHPEVVILHRRDQVGFAGESDPALFKFANGEANVRATEVNRRAANNVPLLACFFQQQPHPGAIEEREVAKAIEPSQPQTSR